MECNVVFFWFSFDRFSQQFFELLVGVNAFKLTALNALAEFAEGGFEEVDAITLHIEMLQHIWDGTITTKP